MNTPDGARSMNTPDTPKPRQPVQPSTGGLLGRHFTYRPAAQTDVRVTWERAKKQSPHPQPPAR